MDIFRRLLTTAIGPLKGKKNVISPIDNQVLSFHFLFLENFKKCYTITN